MKKNLFSKNRGVILVMVVGIVVVSVILFASIVDRVRSENVLTNRASINERLYQVASALGRLSAKKLQKDIEGRDLEHGAAILDAVFDQNATGILKQKDYTKTILNLDTTKQLLTHFQSDPEWGKRGKLDISVFYTIDLGNSSPFSLPLDGLSANPYERRGTVKLDVTATQMGISKKCTIQKEFFLTYLLAPPFYRFTFFAHRGADLPSHLANNLLVKEDGTLESSQSKKPLVFLNRLIKTKKEQIPTLDFRNFDDIIGQIGGKPSFVKSGWIYLGTSGFSTSLKLNVLTGSADQQPLTDSYGEFFHLYYHQDSSGWLINSNETTNLNTQAPNNNDRFQVTFVDYGFHKNIWRTTFPAASSDYLFSPLANMFETPSLASTDVVRNSQGDALGSSVHLFGTPALCTPTLIFGPVERRFIRTHALFSTELGRVHPLAARPFNSTNYPEKVFDYFKEVFTQKNLDSSYDQANVDDIINNFFDPTSFSRLRPRLIEEPYMESLKNIAEPLTSPRMSWGSAIPQNLYNNPSGGGSASATMDPNSFFFSNDEEIRYTGTLPQLQLPNNFLRDRMTYFFDTDTETIMLSKFEFFQDKFVQVDSNKNEKLLYLDQIVGFKGNLVIDEPLLVARGGIIICEGTITIQAPIINALIDSSSISSTPNTPSYYGYLTLISKEAINVNLSKGSSNPVVYAFLISMNEDKTGRVELGAPVHIFGGVATDGDMNSFVREGAVIEWGFEPEEFVTKEPMQNPDFYGFSLSPMELEVVIE